MPRVSERQRRMLNDVKLFVCTRWNQNNKHYKKTVDLSNKLYNVVNKLKAKLQNYDKYDTRPVGVRQIYQYDTKTRVCRNSQGPCEFYTYLIIMS